MASVEKARKEFFVERVTGDAVLVSRRKIE
jgi:hypothetical protein